MERKGKGKGRKAVKKIIEKKGRRKKRKIGRNGKVI